MSLFLFLSHISSCFVLFLGLDLDDADYEKLVAEVKETGRGQMKVHGNTFIGSRLMVGSTYLGSVIIRAGESRIHGHPSVGSPENGIYALLRVHAYH